MDTQGNTIMWFPGENVSTVSISETGEDETEEIDIHQVTAHPDRRAGSEGGKSLILSKLHHEEETEVRSHQEVKEDNPVNICEDGSEIWSNIGEDPIFLPFGKHQEAVGEYQYWFLDLE
ncbi:uncharacterized protein O3C94_022835 [Discoglossus pictus]